MKNVLNVLKPGEIKAIKDNYDPKTNRVYKNCIALNTTASVTLRTNGEVIYGLYTEGTKTIGFTHNPKYKEPYVQDKEYFFYKEKVLKAWRAAFNEKAQDKYYAVQAVIAKLKEANTNPSAVQVQEPVLNTVNNKIEKEEVKDMNKKTVQEIVELNIMQMAHKLRRELKLEGHYHVQMKIAMDLAWQVKKGESTIEIILNNNEVSAEATHTYNAEATAVETVEEVLEEPVQEEPVVAEPIVEEPTEVMEETVAQEKVEPVTSVNFRFYLHSLSKGQAVFYCKDMNSGHAAPCFKMAAKHIRTLDSDFANKYLSKLLHQAPNNTVIEYYGDFTYITFMNNDSLRQLAASKNITLTLGVAPSGDVA